MRSKKRQGTHILIASAILFIVGGCTSAQINATPQITSTLVAKLSSPTVYPKPTFTNRSTHTPTFILEPTPISTPRPSSTFMPIEGPFPDIVLYLGVMKMDQCLTEKRNQIWYSTYPYETVQPLLADPGTDYNYPQWSPDGNWIAYIESKPSIILDWKPSPIITGTDSVWIMRSDGSDRHSVSDNIPSTIIRGMNGCLITSNIVSPPVWSPDSQHIVFVQSFWDEKDNRLNYSYYLAHADSGKTRLLLSQKNDTIPVWVPNNDQIVLVGETGEVKVISGLANDHFNIAVIPLPPEVQPETEFRFSSRVKDNVLISSFFQGSTYASPKPKFQSLWELNVDTGQWKKLIDLNKESWFNPIFGNHWSALCDDKGITILDPLTWQVVGMANLPSGTQIYCKSFKIIAYESVTDVVSFIGSVYGNEGLWAISLQPGNPEPKLIINFSTLTSIVESHRQIFDYSFKP